MAMNANDIEQLIKAGIQIGVAGVKNGSTVTANLIVIP